ncbi:MAG TPA: V-type ATP synthase subunit D [Tepidimicrobium sp.]|nr:V-type ATP synthase subunit D [Tepidimicrobium sp.]
MARLDAKPTRMELTRLRGRLSIATRGHKLLKDKQDELMRVFITKVRENQALRKEVEKELHEAFQEFLLASAAMSPELLEQAVAYPKEHISVDIKRENIMGVNAPVMDFVRQLEGDAGSIYPYGFVQTSSELDDAISKLYGIMDKLLELAEVEKACQLMADEIEKTRRRVNALEFRTIPELEETIKYIVMKLDENERSTITRLMKVKDIIEADA